MNRPGFPVTDSTLSPEALVQRVLRKYNLPHPITCTLLNRGVNDTYAVKAGSSTWYLRAYRHGWRTREQIQAELDMLTHLHRQGFAVSYPIKRQDKSYLTQIAAPEGIRYAALFTEAPGRPVFMNVKQSCAYGELVARIHACLDQSPDDHRRFHLDFKHLIDTPLDHIQPFLHHRKHDFDYLKQVGNAFKQRIDDLLPRTKPEYGNCHGDHHGYNVHIDKTQKMTLYDFDCYGYGWRAYDVSVFLWQWVDWSKTGKARGTRRWNAFLKGYSSVRALSAPELQATRMFVPIRHIWWMGLHARAAGAWGRGWIIDNYFDRAMGFVKRWIEHYKILPTC